MTFLRIIRNHKKLAKLGTEIMQHKTSMACIYPKGFNPDREFERQHDRIELFLDIQKENTALSKDVNYLINEYWTGWD